ncbi:hypothetical protein L218DRAFT_952828 [Marasmius fiardii PR-910]|nr:hypothetical protein L218DRAFT_952828 [Marasmius fiardii PR-910]
MNRRTRLRQILSDPDYLTWSIFGSIVVVILAALISLLFTVSFSGPVTENDALSNSEKKDGIVLIGHAFDIKAGERSMKIQWKPSACGALYNSTQSPSSTNPGNGGKRAECGRPNRKVSIYMNNEVDNATWTYDPDKVPVNRNGFQGNLNVPTNFFVVDTQIDIYTWVLGTNKCNVGLDFLYPFVHYEMTSSFFAVSETSNSTFTPIAIVDAVLVTATDNYVPGETETHSEYSVTFPGAETDTRVPVLINRFSIKTSNVARTFTMVLFFVNWGLVVLVLFMTVSLLVRKMKYQKQVPESILAMPLTIILMIPGLRALFIGDPPFGNLVDLLGFFPQMMIVAVCSFVLLVLMGQGLDGNYIRGKARLAHGLETASLLEEKEGSELKVHVIRV